MHLRPGDIVLVRGERLIPKLIRFFERAPGERKSQVNHAAIVTIGGTESSAVVVEALARVVQRRFNEGRRHDLVAVYRYKLFDFIKQDRVSRRAEAFLGKRYGYVKIITHVLDWLLGGRFVFRRLAQVGDYPICSWVVAQAYASVGIKFGVPAGAATPDDIWDYVTRRPEHWECVRPLSPVDEK